MSYRAWLYVFGVIASGIAFAAAVWATGSPARFDWHAFAILTSLATLSQLYKTEAPNHVVFYVTPVFLFASVLLLDPALYVLLCVTYNLVEWVKARIVGGEHLRAWYIQPFNIASDIITGLSAYWVYGVLSDLSAPLGGLKPIVAGVGAALSLICITYALLGLALILSRGKRWRETGLLNGDTFLSDLTLLLIGYVISVLWGLNPWYTLIAASPLVLLYRVLMIPQLIAEAQTDSKTGLLNSRYFSERCADALLRCQRAGQPLALLMADLDYLRTINNTYGHLAGDAVLVGIADLIRGMIRSRDLAARFGGEEFVIVLPETTQAQAQEIAERLRLAVESANFQVETSPQLIRATMSFGIACYPADASSITQLTHKADIAVYHAKISGRNRVVCVSDLPPSVVAAGIPDRSAEAPPIANAVGSNDPEARSSAY